MTMQESEADGKLIHKIFLVKCPGRLSLHFKGNSHNGAPLVRAHTYQYLDIYTVLFLTFTIKHLNEIYRVVLRCKKSSFVRNIATSHIERTAMKYSCWEHHCCETPQCNAPDKFVWTNLQGRGNPF
jgi:hypothetical protein